MSRFAIDEPARVLPADTCDTCGDALIARALPGACQCPDDEPAECEGCHEEPATTGFRLCPGCSRVVRNSREIGRVADAIRGAA